MKILFYDFNIPEIIKNLKTQGGGSSVQTLHWINGLKHNGIRIGVIVDLLFNDLHTNSQIDFIRSFNYKYSFFPFNWIFHRFFHLNRSIKIYKPDFVYQSGAGFITFILAFICNRNGIRFIHRIANDVDIDNRLKYRLTFVKRFFYDQGLKLSNVIFCQNDYQYELLKKRFPKKRIKKIHNPKSIEKLKLKMKTIDERKYFAWLGIFQEQKNLQGLLKIANTLPDVMFHVAGEPANKIDVATKDALDKLKKCRNVKFVGFLNRTEIYSFLGGAKALINTSLYEGFSNTFLESFETGTPIITTSKVDPDNIISKNKLGLVGNNYDEIPELISKIINNKSYDQLSKKCRDYVINNHDPVRLSKKILSYLVS